MWKRVELRVALLILQIKYMKDIKSHTSDGVCDISITFELIYQFYLYL
jgi:hypothetical protein